MLFEKVIVAAGCGSVFMSWSKNCCFCYLRLLFLLFETWCHYWHQVSNNRNNPPQDLVSQSPEVGRSLKLGALMAIHFKLVV